jgi:perosamine synthetase
MKGATMNKPMKIPLAKPDISDLERELVMETLNTPHLSLGPRLGEFEKKFADFLGVKHAVAVNSGTSALHLCVKALDIQEGDLVATTPFSFVASANSLLFERARPLFVDIDPVTLNIDVSKLEEALREAQKKNIRVKGLLPVHIFGRTCEMESIMGLAEGYGLCVIEDACEALGAEIQISSSGNGNGNGNGDGNGNGGEASWRKAGTFGDCAAFGFYPNKQMTTGEGGMIVTDDDGIAAACRSRRNQGRSPAGTWLQHETLGYNYRLSEINCALGIAQLSRLPETLEKRQRIAQLYLEKLSSLEGITLPTVNGHERISWFVFVVRLSERFSRDDRDVVLGRLRENGIECSNYFTPIHLQPFYRSQFGFKEHDFPVTEAASERTVALPLFNALTEGEIDYVCENLKDALGAIRRRALRALPGRPSF